MIGEPLTSLRFYVTLLPGDAYLPAAQLAEMALLALGGFTEVTGLSGSLEVLPYPEGGRNDYVHQLPVRHTWEKLTLRRGITRGPDLWSWYQAGLRGHLGARRDGTIILLDEAGLPAIVWTFRGGLATRWNGPELKATGSAVAVEAIEITHNGIEQARVFAPERV